MDTYIEYFSRITDPEKQYIIVPTEQVSNSTKICYVFTLLNQKIERIYEVSLNTHYHSHILRSKYHGSLINAPLPYLLKERLYAQLCKLLIDNDRSNLSNIFLTTSTLEDDIVSLYWFKPIENVCLTMMVSSTLEVIPEHLSTFAISNDWQNLMESMIWRALIDYGVTNPPKETIEVMENLSLL